MAKELVQQSTSPSGGMNQDDSMIAPSVGTEGISNYYQSGDYKYALNARIGSSRGDTFGDLESIISTLKVEDYNAYSSLVSIPMVTSSKWSNLGLFVKLS